MTNTFYRSFDFGRKTKANEELQRRLGMSPSFVDGIFGEETRGILKAWQKRNGLPESGVVDRATEDLLFPGNFERRTPSMNINSNWLSGIVTSTAFKYLVTIISTFIASKLGLESGNVEAIIVQLVGVLMGLWGMWEASKSKVVVDGKRVEVKDLTPADQAKVAAVVEKAAAK